MATRTVTLARMNRWAILAGFGMLAGCTQLLWLAYAPITTQVHRTADPLTLIRRPDRGG